MPAWVAWFAVLVFFVGASALLLVTLLEVTARLVEQDRQFSLVDTPEP